MMRAGDRFNVHCRYHGDTAERMRIPLEKCVGYGYFFPATTEIGCD